MAEKVLMLALSPTMETGQIAKWIKQEGERFAEGDVLCEVETDKATMDYEASLEGTLLKILKPEGSSASVGEAIAIAGEEGEDISAMMQEETATQAETVPLDVPKPPQEDFPSSAKETVQQEGEQFPPNTAEQKGEEKRLKISPLARTIASRSGVDLSHIQGSGPDGRIVKRDLQRGESSIPSQKTEDSVVVQEPPVLQNSPAALGEADQIILLSMKRRTIAKRLSESKFGAPHYYVKMSMQMDALMRLRSEVNKARENKVSFNAFLMKFVAHALKNNPIVNSSWQEDTILQFARVDIALAVAQKDGLITPVVRNVDSKGILQIDSDLQEMIEKARNNQLSPEEYSGATFSISNLGSFGVDEFTAIINPPGSAILAIGKMDKQPVFDKENNMSIKTIMKVSLSADHRVIDGAVAAEFLLDLKRMIESPVQALL